MTLDTSLIPAAIMDAIRDRRTAGDFADAEPDRALIDGLIEAARWAPNHRLTEPWRFAVVGGAARAELGEAVAAELRAEGRQGEAEKSAAKLRRAPVIVVVAQARPDGGADAERDLEDYASCACATQNLLLAAHAAGLAAKWSTGKLVHSAAAKRFLGWDAADRIVGYVYLGAPAGAPRAARRRPAAELTRWFD